MSREFWVLIDDIDDIISEIFIIISIIIKGIRSIVLNRRFFIIQRDVILQRRIIIIF